MKTVFNYNTPVTAEWFNVINGFRLRFDGNPLLPGDMVDGQYLPIRLQDLDPAILADYAQSIDIVTTNTDQNINGNKAFLNPVTIPSGVNPTDAVNKSQLDTYIAGADNTTVKVTTVQTITGVKTFTNPITIPSATEPQQAIAKSQLDAVQNNCVNLAGSQTITGVKTFNNYISVPNGVAPNHAVNKLQLDYIYNNAVNLNIAQTIAGAKTFTTPINIPNGVSPNNAVNLSQLLGAVTNAFTFGGSFIKFSNGLVITWGYQVGGGGQSQGFGYNFSFASNPIVITTPVEANQTVMSAVSNINTTGYTFWGRLLDGGNISLTHHFIAIGYDD